MHRTEASAPRSPLRRQANGLAVAAAALAAALAVPSAQAHDYPTADRVTFVQTCMRDHPGPNYEMVNKCSCVLDKLAQQFSHDEFVTMSTASNANSIGGERGNTIRDTESLQVEVRKYRKSLAEAKQGCFIGAGPR